MNPTRISGALAAAAALATFVITVPAASAAAGFTTTMVNAGSSLCADEFDWSTTAGLQIEQWTCNGGTNQNFAFNPAAGGNGYTIAPNAAGDCLDISGASTADNAQVIQWPCNGQPNQTFNVTAAGSGTFRVAAASSGKCIAPAGDSTASNTGLVQVSCTSAATRQWRLAGDNQNGGGSTSCNGTCVQYNGGSNGVITQSPKVYLVFYGSQWGGSGGSIQSQAQGFFSGLGQGGERWSTILTQYCNAVPTGTVTCPSNAAHIPYPTSQVYAGTWFDSSVAAPPQPGNDLITEARNAAAHFGVTSLARSIFVIFSPSGTSAGGGFAWHTTTSDGYNVINAPFVENNTIVLSHEYAETMTDVNAGWTTPDHSAEVGDLCGPDGNLNLPTGSFPVTSVWSNAAHACVVSG